jgi:hypothetical protein
MTTLDQRRGRVNSGSRRKRDLTAVGLTDHADREAGDRVAEALAQHERETRLRPSVKPSLAADTAWIDVRAVLREAVSESTFALWLDPLDVLGEVSGGLAVEAPDGIFAWIFRRYGALLGHAVRDATDYRGAFLFRAPPPSRGDDEGLL